MGIAYRIDDPPGACVIVWDGIVEERDILAFIDIVSAEPRWLAGGCLLSDLSTLDPSCAPTRAQRERYALRYARDHRFASSRWAAVAHRTFGTTSEFGVQLGAGVGTFIVFNDVGMAARWLGIPEAEARRVVQELRAAIRAADSAAPPA